jgi:hypothetical protein
VPTSPAPTLMRSVGTSVCSAVAGAVLAQLTVQFGGTHLPSQNAFRVIMAIGAAAALVAAAIAALLPGRPAAVRTDRTAEVRTETSA